MSVIDPIADMLARIRNASAVGHNTVAVPHSNIKAAIAQILKEEGFIQDFEVASDQSQPDAAHLAQVHGRPAHAQAGDHRAWSV